MTDIPQISEAQLVRLSELTPHPRNYRHHPPEQVEEIAASIQEATFYRNIVTARDLTILAGHGTALGAELLGMEEIPVVVLDLAPDSPEAMKILAADNELSRFSEDDDRRLSNLLKEIHETHPSGLRGTGYTTMMLTNLLMNTRPASEIRDFDAAAEWVGMPEFTPASEPVKLVISFTSPEDRQKFVDEHELELMIAGTAAAWQTRWPFIPPHDLKSVRFDPA